MKKGCVILSVLFICVAGTYAWGQCPGQQYDTGICDTMYVEPWPEDTLLQGAGPYFVRVPIYVTHDIPVDSMDSVAGFAIPLCYIHGNPAKYCSLSSWWNNTNLSGPSLTRSIFRDIDGVQNWMLDLYEEDPEYEWPYIILNLDGTSHFWLAMLPTIQPHFGAGSKVLLASMTFKLQDTMQICIDTCLWPPNQNLSFCRIYYGDCWVPRMGMPHNDTSYEVCFNFNRVPFVCGDANGDGIVEIGDVVYLIRYVYKGGPPPLHWGAGDVNNNGIIDLEDVVYLINYLFKNGPEPFCT